MKKKIGTLLVAGILAMTSLFANGNEISKNAQATFATDFAKATEVKWDKEDDYYKASFKLNGQSLNALLSEEGNLIAVSRNILSTELPVSLQLSLGKIQSTDWITALTEYAVDNETRYFITLENADYKVVFENAGTYDWLLVKKIAK